MNVIKDWIAAATADELVQLADKAGTTVGTLRQIAGGYKSNGEPRTSAMLARNIELAAAALHREGLPFITREQLCKGCGECEFAKACRN